jgi:hypothetical protein
MGATGASCNIDDCELVSATFCAGFTRSNNLCEAKNLNLLLLEK